MREVVRGLGAALAVSFPAVAIGVVLLALEDGNDDLEPTVRVVLLIAVLLGPAVGGAVAARGDASRLASVFVGVVALVLITAFGLAREVAADSDPNVGLVLPAALVGAVLGWVGGTLRAAWPGRTRR